MGDGDKVLCAFVESHAFHLGDDGSGSFHDLLGKHHIIIVFDGLYGLFRCGDAVLEKYYCNSDIGLGDDRHKMNGNRKNFFWKNFLKKFLWSGKH